MEIKQKLALRSSVLKGHVNKYALVGLSIAICSIVFATIIVSYQMFGTISLRGMIEAQMTNPAIWALDLTPFMFAYWGQAFCYELASKAESIIEDKTREYAHKSDDLESKLKYESQHDNLTNLPNARLFAQRITQGIGQISKNEQLVVILISINNFREINYNIGTYSANNLLIQFAEKLKTILLEPYMLQAYMGMNMIARLQSAEFAFLIPRLRTDHNLMEILQRITEETSVNFMIDGNSVEINTTAGVAIYPQHGTKDEELIQHASLALLSAEREKKTYAFYEPWMERNFKSKRIMIKELADAIDNDQLQVLYQPVFNLLSDALIGLEAVVQFQNSKFGNLGSEKLIPLIESTPLIQHLTAFTLEKAISHLAHWHSDNHKIYLRVNLFSVIEPNLPNVIQDLLTRFNVEASYLRIELTEKACLSDQTHTIKILKELSDMGIKIAISDFGSGYSSFIYLTNFPIDEVKIDRSFTKNMMNDEKKHSIVQAIITLADSLQLGVFAEGITDQSIKDELVRLGCKQGQGAYFSEAKGSADVIALIKSN